MKLPRNFVYSNSEYVITYKTKSGSSGEIIIDCNYYDRVNKILQSKLKGCEITQWIQRRKENKYES